MSLVVYLGHGIFYCIRYHSSFIFFPKQFLGEVLSSQTEVTQKKRGASSLYRSMRHDCYACGSTTTRKASSHLVFYIGHRAVSPPVELLGKVPCDVL